MLLSKRRWTGALERAMKETGWVSAQLQLKTRVVSEEKQRQEMELVKRSTDKLCAGLSKETLE